MKRFYLRRQTRVGWRSNRRGEIFLLGGGGVLCLCLSVSCVCDLYLFDGSYKDYVKEGAAQEGAYWVDDARTVPVFPSGDFAVTIS